MTLSILLMGVTVVMKHVITNEEQENVVHNLLFISQYKACTLLTRCEHAMRVVKLMKEDTQTRMHKHVCALVCVKSVCTLNVIHLMLFTYRLEILQSFCSRKVLQGVWTGAWELSHKEKTS